ncbi:MAG: DNA methyltransferase [Lysobacteraceae bacterium]|nr:MAG: DNA methyltransferase [Xanthomonadaceae bacterium]
MSKLLIGQYLNDLAQLRQISGSTRESVVREAFKDLLKGYARSHELVFVPEFEIESPAKERRYVDGALLHALRLPFGYWEAKDEKDDLDTEIETKFRRGYPKDNIIFEDSTQAVLIQNGQQVIRCKVDDVEALEKLLGLFFGYQRPEIAEFRKAVEQFTADLPQVLTALRKRIDAAYEANAAFRKASGDFLDHARKAINPNLTDDDVREILIQHILTDEIFDEVFPGQPFHKDNNVARELHKLEDTFFTGNTKFQTLKSLEIYYRAIRAAAARIGSHHEKQSFLKVVYESFYKVYNPKAADRLGVVYTPNEIVRFMIESADWLCERHFGRNLIDRDVEILDPAVGTGTFITELIEHFRGQPAKLKHKYREELHANEVALLPYYVANLTFEATSAAIVGVYEEFPGLCLVDTLDNTAGLGRKTGDQVADLFGMGDENVARIKRQNRRKISVIIGNPPYNANQLNENDNNKNRDYPEIDKRIKDSYIKESTAKKTKLKDMYARFFRWTTDRLHDDGIIAFVTNNSFIEAQGFDGFRACLAKDFNEIWVINLKGAARGSGEPRKMQGGNIFSNKIRVGVAVWFCVRAKHLNGCRINYDEVRDYASAEEKRDFLSSKPLRHRQVALIKPSVRNEWISVQESEFDQFLPLVFRHRKGVKIPKKGSLFASYALGVSTNRDEWVYSFDSRNLENKVKFFLSNYDGHVSKTTAFNDKIKWSETLKRRSRSGVREVFVSGRIRNAAYRPFSRMFLYQSDLLIDRPGGIDLMFPLGRKNFAICFSDVGSRSGYVTMAIDGPADLHFGASSDGYQQVSLWRFDESGERVDNITDWALKQFKDHYQAESVSAGGKKSGGKRDAGITKEAIFHYVYAVLHDPAYRETYALNLKREFPRIPLYGDTLADFRRWAGWGKALMDLHIGYEAVEPWPLQRTDVEDEKARRAGQAPKAMLKADKAAGRIVLDSETTLSGVPAAAWKYTLGNRCALEWILDQYKESKPRDPTIREKFDTYRFADYKDHVIDLLMRVTRVSVDTQSIVEEMNAAPRH